MMNGWRFGGPFGVEEQQETCILYSLIIVALGEQLLSPAVGALALRELPDDVDETFRKLASQVGKIGVPEADEHQVFMQFISRFEDYICKRDRDDC